MYDTGMQRRVGTEAWREDLRRSKVNWRLRRRIAATLTVMIGSPATLVGSLAFGASGQQTMALGAAWLIVGAAVLATVCRPAPKRVFARR